MATTDDWTKSAMRDGEIVAELLVTLKEAKVVKPILFANPTVTALRWGIRQPRSQSPRKETESAISSRCSPSTPLSWSGGYGGSSSSPPSCYEATSRRITGSSFAIGSRSTNKILVSADLDYDVKKLQKKNKKKKKKDIALLRSPFTENKNSKRMKIDVQNLTENEDEKEDGNFLLPDLNIMPCEENSEQQYSSMDMETTLYGIRV